MAEIQIEKKKTPVWPWIILALIVIGVVVYLLAFTNDADSSLEGAAVTNETIAESSQNAPNNSTVNAYVSFVEDDPEPMALDHEFTNNALMKLTNATEAMANDINYDIRKDIEAVKTQAEEITTDPFETTHANSIREAADILASALHQMQAHAFSDFANEASQVKNAAASIEMDVLTLDQKSEVKNFFRESADLLEKMNNNTPKI